MTELLGQIKVVAEVRESAQKLTEAKRIAYERWLADNDGLLKSIEEANALVSAAETNLRELTIKAYQETGNKTPAPGVGIREVTKLEYDAKEAFNWAVEHKIMLKLDTPAFEKMAKMAPETRPGFVKVHTDPQATIATDLSKILQEVE